jgi:catechol 2,3-dioxygenase
MFETVQTSERQMPAFINPQLEAHRASVVIASVKLAVHDLDLQSRFYREMLGLKLLSKSASDASLGVDGHALVHLHLRKDALMDPTEPGLFHTAFLLPDRFALARFIQHTVQTKLPLEGAAHHGVSEALYLSDPEGNGIEVYSDLARSDWPHNPDGSLALTNERLDLRALLALAPEHSSSNPYQMPAGSRIGHVHLCVSDLEDAKATVPSLLEMERMASYPSAHFFGNDGYHHHIATNIWRARKGAVRSAGSLGLDTLALRTTSQKTYDRMSAVWLGAGGAKTDAGISLTTLNGLNFALEQFAAS